ncbi:Lrp/AsnC family transcriptional regulator [Mesorhizobium sp. CN2-181]|uniref:Lrp/AsnC family transcriptional regulator n=1 Tax=Mesorhizobium yinganensis TaxID=3157707 RepID=UPI0032B77FA4
MDRIDRRLLLALREDSQRSISELGQLVGLSPSACHRRVKLLEQAGIIKAYRAELDETLLGFGMSFFIEVVLTGQDEATLDAFEATIVTVPEVLECHLMAGHADYVLRVACRNGDDFERIHRALVSRLPGVARVQSNMTIRTVKRFSGVPL